MLQLASDPTTRTIHRSGAAGPVCLEDLQLRPRFRAAASRGERTRLAAELRRLRPAVARRLHHSGAVPGSHQGSVRRRPKLENLLLASVLHRGGQQGSASLAARVSTATELGLPVPAFSTALAYYDSYRREPCRPTCCKRSATTSVRTPISGSIEPGRSTPIGLQRASR